MGNVSVARDSDGCTVGKPAVRNPIRTVDHLRRGHVCDAAALDGDAVARWLHVGYGASGRFSAGTKAKLSSGGVVSSASARADVCGYPRVTRAHALGHRHATKAE